MQLLLKDKGGTGALLGNARSLHLFLLKLSFILHYKEFVNVPPLAELRHLMTL